MRRGGVFFELTMTGHAEARKAISEVINSVGPGKMRQILRDAGKPILKQAKKNARGLGNKGAAYSVKTRNATKNTGGGKYKLAKEFADAIVFKTPRHRQITRITIGPLQDRLNAGTTVKWKGREVPMAHWKEAGTKAGMEAGYPVWKAYRQKKKISQNKLKGFIYKNIDKATRKTAYLYFKKMGL